MIRRAAFLLIAAVAGALGVATLARRRSTPGHAARAAGEPAAIATGTRWYRVERNGRPVGYAMSVVDTGAYVVRADDIVHAEGADGRPLHLRAELELTRTLALLGFSLDLQGVSLPLRVDVDAHGDSALLVRVSSGGEGAPAQLVPTRGPGYPPSAVPLLFARAGPRRVGETLTFALFDPTTVSTRVTHWRVTAESLFTVSDSSRFDTAVGRWRSVRSDTVRAWRVEADGTAAGMESWIDGGGRVVQARYPGGYVLRRTTRDDATSRPPG